MTRYTVQTEDGKVHYMDAEIEERVKALERVAIALLEAAGGDTTEISTNLQSSLDFEAQLAEEEAQAQTMALTMQAEGMPEDELPEEGAGILRVTEG